MRRKISVVLALAMVFVMMMSSVAMADPPDGSVIISDVLEGKIDVRELEKSVQVQVWGAVNGEVKGYSVDFELINAKVSDAESITVSLYKEVEKEGEVIDILLQENQATEKVFNELAEETALTSPFDAWGTYNYIEDGYWEIISDEKLYHSAVIPDKVVVEVIFEGQEEPVTATSYNLTQAHKISEFLPPRLMTMSWAEGNPPVNPISPFEISVTAALYGEVKAVSDVLFIIEIDEDEKIESVVAEDGQKLGYDKEGDYWYWGPKKGFIFDSAKPVTTTFTVTAETGEIKYKIYAVQFRP